MWSQRPSTCSLRQQPCVSGGCGLPGLCIGRQPCPSPTIAAMTTVCSSPKAGLAGFVLRMPCWVCTCGLPGMLPALTCCTAPLCCQPHTQPACRARTRHCTSTHPSFMLPHPPGTVALHEHPPLAHAAATTRDCSTARARTPRSCCRLWHCTSTHPLLMLPHPPGTLGPLPPLGPLPRQCSPTAASPPRCALSAAAALHLTAPHSMPALPSMPPCRRGQQRARRSQGGAARLEP